MDGGEVTLCPGRERGVPPHDARHVSVRIEIPWPDRADQPVRVAVVHRCEQYGCPLRLEEREEPAVYPEHVLRKVLSARGMLGCSHDPQPVAEQGVPHSDVYLPCATGVCGHVEPHGRPPKKWRPSTPQGPAPDVVMAFDPNATYSQEEIDEAARRFLAGMDALRDHPRPAVGQRAQDPDRRPRHG